jgi:predicted RecA/RadA family phage recombinase
VLKEYLAVYLKETQPTASDIQDAQIFTRVIERGRRMQAQFKFFYTIKDESGDSNKIAREGVFLLDSENGNDWTAKMAKISDTYLEFSDALQISLSGENKPAATEATQSKEAKAK